MKNAIVAANKKAPKDMPGGLDDMAAPAGGAVLLKLDDIEPDPRQPRSSFRPVDGRIAAEVLDALQDLAGDIAANSLIQPIVVRKEGGRYTIIAGERRWRAFRLNREKGVPGSDRIPAVVRQDLTAARLRLAQLAENLQRSDLSDIETAVYIQELLTEYPDLRKKDIGQLLHKKGSGSGSQYVSRILAMLDPQWADVVQTGIISFASLLEQYRPLPRAEREQLKELAIRENRALTSGDIRAAKARAAAPDPTPPPAMAPMRAAGGGPGPAAIDPELASQIDQFIAASAPRGETYRPSASAMAPASRPEWPRIRDAGGDAVIPSGIAALNLSMYERREARLTLRQLEKLLQRGALPNKAHQVSIMLPAEELKAAITRVGGALPEDDSHLVMTLLEALNRLP